MTTLEKVVCPKIDYWLVQHVEAEIERVVI